MGGRLCGGIVHARFAPFLLAQHPSRAISANFLLSLVRALIPWPNIKARPALKPTYCMVTTNADASVFSFGGCFFWLRASTSRREGTTARGRGAAGAPFSSAQH